MIYLLLGAIVLILLVAQGVMLVLVLRKNAQTMPALQNADSMAMLQKQIETLERSLDSRMSESSRNVKETMRRKLRP
jgi:hypothetical protein